MESKLLKIQKINCPLCDSYHEVEERERVASIIIKDDEINYIENYFFCSNSDDGENEFTTGKMENCNLLNARNSYRKKHGLLTSEDIVGIREEYGLSQIDLARLLNWGEATISRYESKAIQEDAYDNTLRMIHENPLAALELLHKNKELFTTDKYISIEGKIISKLDTTGKEYLKRKTLECDYVVYRTPSDLNGYSKLNVDKIEAVISYFASRVDNLPKAKLMKMLWYADALYFQKANTSITGLVYRNESMGALPLGHYDIVGLENVIMKEEENIEGTVFHFFNNSSLDYSCLNDEEKNVLIKVINKFSNWTSREIVEYMKKESVYMNVKQDDIIPYSLAHNLNDF